MMLDEADAKLNIIVDLIPKGCSNRPGTKIQPSFITIHNTANRAPGADALAHARYLKGPDARRREVSWHYTVDDTRCVKHLPLSEMGWHAGRRGNERSIGIEVCESEGIDQEAAFDRACLLAAVLARRFGIRPGNIVTHKRWTGKNCPKVILHSPGGMHGFVERATAFLAVISA